jgi:excisionase family DNA binding protein
MTSETRLMTVTALSEYLSVARPTLYSWVCLGRIPSDAIVRLGRCLRFDRERIDAWIEAGREGSSRS